MKYLDPDLSEFAVSFIPDPEGYPLYKDPGSGLVYRCIASYANAAKPCGWYAFGIVEETPGDILFFGYYEGTTEFGFVRFSRNDVQSKSGAFFEFDAELLQGIDPPSFIAGPGKMGTWEKLDGPVHKSVWLKRYSN